MIFSKKTKFFLLIIVLTLISIPSIYASDFENITVENDHATTTDSLSLNENAIGTFDDLDNDFSNLSPGDVYNMDKDYLFDPGCGNNGPLPALGDHGIDIRVDNVTINGNGHCIDGNHKTNILKVTGNNVKIFNLTFTNSKYEGYQLPIKGKTDDVDGIYKLIVKVSDDMSPVDWTGDNGLISNCIFSHNTALNGGAIKWSGNNGVINNSLFINNVARGVGGAIYIAGANIAVANTFMINSTSQLTREAIYSDSKSKNFTCSNCTTNNAVFLIEGNYSGIDVDNYLRHTYYSQVGDKWIDLIPIMYKAITLGFANIDDNLAAYAQYGNDTGDFTFSVIRNYHEFDIQYQKNYVFTKTTLNDAFELLLKDNYKNTLVMSKSINVTTKNGYKFACDSSASTYISNNKAFINMIGPDLLDLNKDMRKFDYASCVTYALNVFFAQGMVIESNAKWNKYSNFGVVNLFGNGAKIVASSGDRDENKWIETGHDQAYMIYNMTAEGFNTAIDNKEGYCVLNNVSLNNNHMDYIWDRDDGAAILNGGVVICNNCSFTNNYAKNGGAIFNQGLLVLDNCTFKGNKGYGTGDDVLNIDQGIVLVNGVNIKGSKGPVTYAESISSFASTFMSTIAVIGTIIAGVGSGILATIGSGGNFIFGIGVGICVGAVAGGILGVGAACVIAPHQYNLGFDRINTAGKIIYSCILTGAFSGFIGGAIMGAYYGVKASEVSEKQVKIINPELEAEDIALGDQLEIDYDFWGPLKKVNPPAEPVIENPEVPSETPTPTQEVRFEIKGFKEINFESRAKISHVLNEKNIFSLDLDCYDCTCGVFDKDVEITEIYYAKGFSQNTPSSFVVKYNLPNGKHMMAIFGFDGDLKLIPDYPKFYEI